MVVDASLIGVFREAFPDGVPPERPVTGHRCLECDQVDALVGGRTWWEIAEDFPAYCEDTFPLLTPHAKVYYAPAFMCHQVRSPLTVCGTSLESALEAGELRPEQFTAPQRAVISCWAEEYYEEIRDDNPPEQMIANWRGRHTDPD
jgi:hypothetical protein